MTDVQTTNNNAILDSHYSTNLKTQRSSSIVAVAPNKIPKHKLFSRKEADKRFNEINLDIYEGTQDKKSEKEFKKSLYFKIFGGIALATACVAGADKIKSFFRKS